MATVVINPISARNQISGKVSEIESGSAMSVVTIAAHGQRFVSAITTAAVKELGLKTNDPVFAVIKSTDTVLMKGDAGNVQISARNTLNGRVSDIRKGEAMGCITVNTESGKLTATITRQAIEDMQIQDGEQVTAVFNATEVLLQKTE
jgi:molybdate transport system regulatory protein